MYQQKMLRMGKKNYGKLQNEFDKMERHVVKIETGIFLILKFEKKTSLY